jgi:oxygen-independent coproporphyrinogen III oxidase
MQDTTPFENRIKPIGFYPLPKDPANCVDFERVANASLPHSGSLLYIHIPFCRQRCAFCFFFDNLYREPQWRTFFPSLLSDLNSKADLPAVAQSTINAIFIGGGSPNVLSPDELGLLLQTIKSRFTLASDCEITLEWYPADQSSEKLAVAKNGGVNRVSIGVQSLDPQRSQRLYLHHTPDQSRRIVEMAMAAGIENVNIDLITCLPGETPEELRAELLAAAAFSSGGISPNPLEVIQETPLQTVAAAKQNHLSFEQRLNHWTSTRDILLDLGYVQQRFCNYHLPGKQHRYNRLSAMPYTNIVAAGPGAYGIINGYVYVNHKDIISYSKAIEARTQPMLTGNSVSLDEMKCSHVVTSLLEMEIWPKVYQDHFGSSFMSDFGDVLESQLARGLVASTGDGNFRLTPLGALWGDNVCLEYYSDDQAALLGLRFARNKNKSYGYHYAPAAIHST